MTDPARTIKAIVNIFETARVLGDYSRVTLIPGDTGQLTYGRSQTTLTSGGLFELVSDYVDKPDADLGPALAPYVGALEEQDPQVNEDGYFHNLLRAAADDPVMRACQDAFFDRGYWQPALAAASDDGLELPLSQAVVYDSHVHGSWRHVRRLTNRESGRAGDIGERAWTTAYVARRLRWLAGHRIRILRATVYRMHAFQALIEADEWELPLPQVVRNIEIDEEALAALPPDIYDGPAVRSRTLRLDRPLQRGADVRRVQLALSERGAPRLIADAIFGPQSTRAVAAFKRDAGLPVDGVVDEAVFDELGL